MIFILILLFGGLLSFWGPWWIAAPVAWIVCRWKAKTGKQAMIQSSASLAALWIFYSLMIYVQSGGGMVEEMAGILTSREAGTANTQSLILILAITTFIATLIGGLAGFAGYRLKNFNR